MSPRLLMPLVALALALLPAERASAAPVRADVVLRGGTVIDGTGAPGRVADVAIKGERIVAVGEFEAAPGAQVIEAAGWVVAPGFIDLHTHSDGPILQPGTRGNVNYLLQGVTTVVTGNCGDGPVKIKEFLARVDDRRAGTNVAALVPHGSVRRSVLGTDDRQANPAELARMRALVARGMDGGAWGLSTGLIYVPGRYADAAELVDLARIVARRGGYYASHLRDEEAGLLGALDEALTIGRDAGLPVHVSHLKASGRENWGLVGPACAKIESARDRGQVVTADQYPYPASSMPLAAMVVPDWARRGDAADFARLAADPSRGLALRDAIRRELDRRDDGAAIRISSYPAGPDRVGLDLLAIARREGSSPLEVVLDIERHGDAMAIDFGQSEADVRHVMARPYVATASDAAAHAPGGLDRPHPRAYGTFPRKVRYALDDGVMPLEQAIRSATGLPARILGLPERGVLVPGAFADVVAFDPAAFRDLATFDEPTRYPRGVRYVFVNGVAAVARGKYQHKLAGRALRLQDDGPAELILRAGSIRTADPDRPLVAALAARKGRVVALGPADAVDRFRGPLTSVIEHPGTFAVAAGGRSEPLSVGASADVAIYARDPAGDPSARPTTRITAGKPAAADRD